MNEVIAYQAIEKAFTTDDETGINQLIAILVKPSDENISIEIDDAFIKLICSIAQSLRYCCAVNRENEKSLKHKEVLKLLLIKCIEQDYLKVLYGLVNNNDNIDSTVSLLAFLFSGDEAKDEEYRSKVRTDLDNFSTALYKRIKSTKYIGIPLVITGLTILLLGLYLLLTISTPWWLPVIGAAVLMLAIILAIRNFCIKHNYYDSGNRFFTVSKSLEPQITRADHNNKKEILLTVPNYHGLLIIKEALQSQLEDELKQPDNQQPTIT